MLAWRIGNPVLQPVDSGFPAITQPVVERDYCHTGERTWEPDYLKDKT